MLNDTTFRLKIRHKIHVRHGESLIRPPVFRVNPLLWWDQSPSDSWKSFCSSRKHCITSLYLVHY